MCEKRVLIIGAGAIGLSLAALFGSMGFNTTLLVRRLDQVNKIMRDGLILQGVLGSFFAPPHRIKIVSDIDLDHGSYDIVLVTVKATDLTDIMQKMCQAHCLFENALIVLFQNGGLQAKEIAAQYFGSERIFSACVFTGFERQAANRARITVHAKAIAIGNIHRTTFSDLMIETCNVLTEAGLPTCFTPDIEKLLLEKLLFNAAVNPVSAIYSRTIGQIANDKVTRMIIESIVSECFSCFAEANKKISWDNPTDYLEHFEKTLVPLTADHYSSMYYDLLSNKCTEVDFLNGSIIKMGERYAVGTDTNISVRRAIRQREARFSTRETSLTSNN